MTHHRNNSYGTGQLGKKIIIGKGNLTQTLNTSGNNTGRALNQSVNKSKAKANY